MISAELCISNKHSRRSRYINLPLKDECLSIRAVNSRLQNSHPTCKPRKINLLLVLSRDSRHILFLPRLSPAARGGLHEPRHELAWPDQTALIDTNSVMFAHPGSAPLVSLRLTDHLEARAEALPRPALQRPSPLARGSLELEPTEE